jgi:hypothetical protein
VSAYATVVLLGGSLTGHLVVGVEPSVIVVSLVTGAWSFNTHDVADMPVWMICLQLAYASVGIVVALRTFNRYITTAYNDAVTRDFGPRHSA